MKLRFDGGGYGTGNDFGDIEIDNVAAQSCKLKGDVHIVALDAQNHTITIYPHSPEVRNANGTVPLSVNGVVVPPLQRSVRPAGVLIGLRGSARDDPRTGELCRGYMGNRSSGPSDEVTPAFWRVRVENTWWTLRNLDASGVDVHSLYGCRASIAIDGVFPTESRTFTATPSPRAQ